MRRLRSERDEDAVFGSSEIGVKFMADGSRFTQPAAVVLKSRLKNPLFDVYYHHGGDKNDKSKGEIVAWHTSLSEGNPRAPERLAKLDIAIVEKESNRALLLVEIEDDSKRPKVILGDALATLVGQGISFHGRKLIVGEWTTFVVCVYLKDNLNVEHHHTRLEFLERTVRRIIPSIELPNSMVGEFFIKGFLSQEEVNEVLLGYLEHLLEDI